MPELLIYLLKVNVALVLFYLSYHVALRRLTFYHLNRLFLVFGIVFSTVYPFIDLSELFARHEPIANAYIVTIPAWAITSQTIAQNPAFDYWQLPVYLFWAGAMVMLIRFIVQLVSLYKVHTASEPDNYKNIGFRKVKTISQAFSFWQTIYLNPEQHQHHELEKILHHELIHITGWHTLDVLLAELSTVFYWFNPGAWLMKKAVKENLEFIADQNVVNTGVDKKEYQYLLLKVVGATQPQIANQFNFPSLKRRIAMMNKMPTSKAGKLRLLIALPLTATLLFAFRNAPPVTEAITSIESEITQQDGNNPNTEKLIAQLKQNRALKSVRSKKIDGKDAIVIRLKGGSTEVYFVSDAASRAELERKYVLPELPPPPPPTPDAPDAPPAPPAPVEQDQQNLTDGVTYYIDGKEDKQYNYKKLAPDQIFSVNVYKGETAEEVFGDKAAKGVVSIITKKNKDSRQVKAFEQRFSVLPTPPPPVPDPEQLPPPPPPAPEDVELPPPPPPVSQDTEETFIFSPANEGYYRNNLPADYKAFLKRNPEVKQVGWKFTNRKDYNLESAIIFLKSGESEEYYFNQNYKIAALEGKYGELPALPAPPPPVRKKN